MNISKDIIPFLTGEFFNASLCLKISHPEKEIINRFNFISNKCDNKKIIHLGCCDHLPLIEEKIKNNVWLHKTIQDVSSKCIGIDINKKGIDFLKQKLNIKNVHHANIEDDNISFIKDESWDYLIMGEILEHIDNPVEFMRKIRLNYQSSIKKVIITVPNAFAYSNYKNTKKHLELINSDHKYWFTPFTMSKILTNAGYSIDEFYFSQDISKKIGLRAKLKVIPFLRRKYLYQLLRKNPALRDTLIVIATF